MRKRISDESVKNVTGKTWNEWFKLLDKEGAGKLSHKDIAKLLYDKKYIKSGWWCQSVAVEYEYAKGRRTVGQTDDVGFEIGVQGTLPVAPEKVWSLLTSKKGLKIWLGDIKDFKFKKGFNYKTKEGNEGELRTLDPGKKIRLTRNSTTLQIYVLPAGKYLSRKSSLGKSKTTSIRFHQENLKTAKEREKMRTYWRVVLKRLKEAI